MHKRVYVYADDILSLFVTFYSSFVVAGLTLKSVSAITHICIYYIPSYKPFDNIHTCVVYMRESLHKSTFYKIILKILSRLLKNTLL